ncbi:MAG: LON peptidase substrate-binding domain-containing protein [Verrucomicrobiae bacterium]|nr:LON peptidase substrate-binding domain-containing protein [Verrucomicrobiae bacterium]
MQMPSQAPFMVLSGVTLFPQALLPLHIFEPRYREMLAGCLEGNRIFGVTSMEKSHKGPSPKPRLSPIAGVGLIRACVEQPDGTSNLILQGLLRVQLTRHIQTSPFLVAEISPLPSTHTDSVEVDALSLRLKEIVCDLLQNSDKMPPHIVTHITRTESPDSLSDLVAYLLLKREDYRREIMETLDLTSRLRKLIRMVPEEIGGNNPPPSSGL